MIPIVAPSVSGIAAASLAQVRAVYDNDPSMFDTVGPQAGRIATLGWALSVAGTVVFIVVMGILLWPIWRDRRAPPVDAPPRPVRERAWLLVAGTAIPAVILAAVFVATLSTARATSPPAAMPLTIEVIGHQWWWEVRYPSDSIRTADEVHIPVGRPVKVLLTSDDVLHSFWVPNLAGKIDLITGVTNATWIQANRPGVWRGQCAEYCGMQHAHMAFSVVAQSPADFARWTQAEREAAVAPSDSATLEGERVFLDSPCVYCHTVRGTQAGGVVGPDLTHLASRLTLAGGTLPNTRGNLAGWIANPDRLKPGTKMPAVPLDGPQLQAVVAYLESLR
jgi:cytochrome c oxidase subunit 2